MVLITSSIPERVAKIRYFLFFKSLAKTIKAGNKTNTYLGRLVKVPVRVGKIKETNP